MSAFSPGIRSRGASHAVLWSALLIAIGCRKPPPAPVYQIVPVERRDIAVSAHANGNVLPDTTVEVKTRASGEVLQILVESGQVVKRGTPLLRIDRRQPRNAVAQAQADLDVALAQLTNAETQKGRSDALLASQSITQQEHDTAVLDYANAKAAVVKARVALENVKIQLEDTDVLAPISGTIIEADVSRGQVIASATSNVGGGTTLLKMADLSLVQVSTLVDETDIGQIHPGQQATVVVDAYPNRPLTGTVLKIEPRDTVVQNVTMFPVKVRIDNAEGLLKPGMNAEVEIHIGNRQKVLAIPNAALRTPRDVGSAAQVLGLDPRAVQEQISRRPGRAATDTTSTQELSGRPAAGADGQGGQAVPAGQGGARSQRPQGAGQGTGTGAGGGAAAAGGAGTGAGAGAGAGAAAGGGAARPNGRRQQSGLGSFAGQWIVFVKKNGVPTAEWIRTGLTDLDYIEVTSGLTEGDSVYILPSASLVQSQQEFKQRITNVTGGGGLPGMSQRSGGAAPAAPAPAAPAR